MLKLRLKRYGRKKQPFYRIVLINSRSRRDGLAIKELGFYNPIDKNFKIDKNLVIQMLKQGVQPTETVKMLLVKANILEKA
jgi:small subunit ribosomal protein S16